LCSTEAAKAQLATAVTAKAPGQAEDHIINEEEELDKQYMAIKINYNAEVIGRV